MLAPKYDDMDQKLFYSIVDTCDCLYAGLVMHTDSIANWAILQNQFCNTHCELIDRPDIWKMDVLKNDIL